jgi:predicted hotdog family 3-hydroxylacyl-ACP dehydratase
MQLDHRWIAAHIPHQGAMCLLEEILEWNATDISCRTATHRLADHPLRTLGHLKAICAIEYAAQAIALHGAVNAAAPGVRPGMLASVRALDLHADRLDDIGGDLLVCATRIGGDETALLYNFSVSGEHRLLAAGRATIVLRSAAAAPRIDSSVS